MPYVLLVRSDSGYKNASPSYVYTYFACLVLFCLAGMNSSLDVFRNFEPTKGKVHIEVF
jgi:hypothetical protein